MPIPSSQLHESPSSLRAYPLAAFCFFQAPPTLVTNTTSTTSTTNTTQTLQFNITNRAPGRKYLSSDNGSLVYYSLTFSLQLKKSQ